MHSRTEAIAATVLRALTMTDAESDHARLGGDAEQQRNIVATGAEGEAAGVGVPHVRGEGQAAIRSDSTAGVPFPQVMAARYQGAVGTLTVTGTRPARTTSPAFCR